MSMGMVVGYARVSLALLIRFIARGKDGGVLIKIGGMGNERGPSKPAKSRIKQGAHPKRQFSSRQQNINNRNKETKYRQGFRG